jgi:hypothetical protein
VVRRDQLLPFQRSASVVVVPEASVEYPTAMQSVADLHETPLSTLPAAPVGFGVVWSDQLVPFKRSAKLR